MLIQRLSKCLLPDRIGVKILIRNCGRTSSHLFAMSGCLADVVNPKERVKEEPQQKSLEFDNRDSLWAVQDRAIHHPFTETNGGLPFEIRYQSAMFPSPR